MESSGASPVPISPDDRALRRIRPLHIVSDPKAVGGLRASAAAFDDDTDGSPMSAYLQSILEGLDLADANVVQGKASGWAVAAIPVQTLIDEEQAVEHAQVTGTPIPHPCDPAHVSVRGVKKPKSRRDRISKASPLVYFVR